MPQPQSLSLTLSQRRATGRATLVNRLTAGAVIPQQVVHNVAVQLNQTLCIQYLKKKKKEASIAQSKTKSLLHRHNKQIQEIQKKSQLQVAK